MSPAELKALLKKAQSANSTFQTYISALEAELRIWREGSHVDEVDWVSLEKANTPGFAPKKSSTPATPARSATPVIPNLESLRGELDSRPQTPTVVGLDKDERDEFLKRENELSDQLAEKESLIASLEKTLRETREEMAFLKEQEIASSKVGRYITF